MKKLSAIVGALFLVGCASVKPELPAATCTATMEIKAIMAVAEFNSSGLNEAGDMIYILPSNSGVTGVRGWQYVDDFKSHTCK